MYIPDQLGTPLTPNATKVLLLGAGELGRELTVSFQRLGVEVHAADRYEGAPAQQVAHVSHLVDVADRAAVLALVGQVRPDFVVSEVDLVAADALAEIEEAGTACVVPSAKACSLTVGRERIRRMASEELGLPTTAYRFATTFEEYRAAVEEMGFPCIVKSTVSASGRSHSVVHSEADVEPAWRNSLRGPAGATDVMVERFVNFDYELSLLAARSIDPETGRLATWFSEPIGHLHRDGDLVESWQPMAVNPRAWENARSMAARITNALGGRGLFGVEMFVAGEDVYFSSVSPRPHETGMVTLSTQRFSEFDLHARAILGMPLDMTLISPGACVILHGTGESDTVSYRGVAEALAVPEVDVRLFGKPAVYPRRRMGLTLATAEDVETARQRAREAAAAITVREGDGDPATD